MVLKKRLDDILIGRQAPAIPRVPKSAKGKRTVRGKAGDDDMSAFNLLAAVAGNLLLERKKSSILRKRTGKSNRSNARYIVKQEETIEEKPLNEEPFHVGSCIEGASGSEFVRPVFCAQVECLKTQNPMALGPASGIINTDSAYGDACTERHFFLAEKLYESKVRDGSRMPPIGESEMTGADLDRNALDACKLENPMEVDAKPPALVSTENDLDVLMRGDQISFNRSFPKCRDDLELAVDRDDDENSSGCTQPSNQTSRYIKPQVIGNPRIRKLLATKFWNAAPTTKMGEFSNTDAKIKHCYQSRRICYSRQKTRRTSFKRKQLFQCCSKSTSKGIISREGRKLSSPIRGQISSYKSRVKLSIKSFKVPELVIEISETSTVGALKRRVMDAVNAVLGGGLRVGVLVQGKKVRDDNKTLRNAGISHMDKLDDLGFTLEPSTVQTISPLSPLTSAPLGCTQEHSNMQNISPCTSIPRGHNLEPSTMQTISPLSRAPLGYTLEPSTMQTISLLSGAEERHSFLACDATRPSTGFPVVASAYDGEKSNVSLELPHVSSINCPESDHESVHSLLSTSSMDKTEIVAREPPAVSVMSNQVLPVDPVNKPGQAELMRRRIRRPFSVPEVEALVQAVEKLGTGRWRDVKLQAFEDAKHRTYVDLKDKWKTLVHTATIAPQQRRGEQVPQELLHRVLSAQAYWSQQQASGPDALCQGLPAPLI